MSDNNINNNTIPKIPSANSSRPKSAGTDDELQSSLLISYHELVELICQNNNNHNNNKLRQHLALAKSQHQFATSVGQTNVPLINPSGYLRYNRIVPYHELCDGNQPTCVKSGSLPHNVIVTEIAITDIIHPHFMQYSFITFSIGQLKARLAALRQKIHEYQQLHQQQLVASKDHVNRLLSLITNPLPFQQQKSSLLDGHITGVGDDLNDLQVPEMNRLRYAIQHYKAQCLYLEYRLGELQSQIRLVQFQGSAEYLFGTAESNGNNNIAHSTVDSTSCNEDPSKVFPSLFYIALSHNNIEAFELLIDYIQFVGTPLHISQDSQTTSSTYKLNGSILLDIYRSKQINNSQVLQIIGLQPNGINLFDIFTFNSSYSDVYHLNNSILHDVFASLVQTNQPLLTNHNNNNNVNDKSILDTKSIDNSHDNTNHTKSSICIDDITAIQLLNQQYLTQNPQQFATSPSQSPAVIPPPQTTTTLLYSPTNQRLFDILENGKDIPLYFDNMDEPKWFTKILQPTKLHSYKTPLHYKQLEWLFVACTTTGLNTTDLTELFQLLWQHDLLCNIKFAHPHQQSLKDREAFGEVHPATAFADILITAFNQHNPLHHLIGASRFAVMMFTSTPELQKNIVWPNLSKFVYTHKKKVTQQQQQQEKQQYDIPEFDDVKQQKQQEKEITRIKVDDMQAYQQHNLSSLFWTTIINSILLVSMLNDIYQNIYEPYEKYELPTLFQQRPQTQQHLQLIPSFNNNNNKSSNSRPSSSTSPSAGELPTTKRNIIFLLPNNQFLTKYTALLQESIYNLFSQLSTSLQVALLKVLTWTMVPDEIKIPLFIHPKLINFPSFYSWLVQSTNKPTKLADSKETTGVSTLFTKLEAFGYTKHFISTPLTISMGLVHLIKAMTYNNPNPIFWSIFTQKYAHHWVNIWFNSIVYQGDPLHFYQHSSIIQSNTSSTRKNYHQMHDFFNRYIFPYYDMTQLSYHLPIVRNARYILGDNAQIAGLLKDNPQFKLEREKYWRDDVMLYFKTFFSHLDIKYTRTFNFDQIFTIVNSNDDCDTKNANNNINNNNDCEQPSTIQTQEQIKTSILQYDYTPPTTLYQDQRFKYPYCLERQRLINTTHLSYMEQPNFKWDSSFLKFRDLRRLYWESMWRSPRNAMKYGYTMIDLYTDNTAVEYRRLQNWVLFSSSIPLHPVTILELFLNTPHAARHVDWVQLLIQHCIEFEFGKIYSNITQTSQNNNDKPLSDSSLLLNKKQRKPLKPLNYDRNDTDDIGDDDEDDCYEYDDDIDVDFLNLYEHSILNSNSSKSMVSSSISAITSMADISNDTTHIIDTNNTISNNNFKLVDTFAKNHIYTRKYPRDAVQQILYDDRYEIQHILQLFCIIGVQHPADIASFLSLDWKQQNADGIKCCLYLMLYLLNYAAFIDTYYQTSEYITNTIPADLPPPTFNTASEMVQFELKNQKELQYYNKTQNIAPRDVWYGQSYHYKYPNPAEVDFIKIANDIEYDPQNPDKSYDAISQENDPESTLYNARYQLDTPENRKKYYNITTTNDLEYFLQNLYEDPNLDDYSSINVTTNEKVFYKHGEWLLSLDNSKNKEEEEEEQENHLNSSQGHNAVISDNGNNNNMTLNNNNNIDKNVITNQESNTNPNVDIDLEFFDIINGGSADTLAIIKSTNANTRRVVQRGQNAQQNAQQQVDMKWEKRAASTLKITQKLNISPSDSSSNNNNNNTIATSRSPNHDLSSPQFTRPQTCVEAVCLFLLIIAPRYYRPIDLKRHPIHQLIIDTCHDLSWNPEKMNESRIYQYLAETADFPWDNHLHWLTLTARNAFSPMCPHGQLDKDGFIDFFARYALPVNYKQTDKIIQEQEQEQKQEKEQGQEKDIINDDDNSTDITNTTDGDSEEDDAEEDGYTAGWGLIAEQLHVARDEYLATFQNDTKHTGIDPLKCWRQHLDPQDEGSAYKKWYELVDITQSEEDNQIKKNNNTKQKSKVRQQQQQQQQQRKTYFDPEHHPNTPAYIEWYRKQGHIDVQIYTNTHNNNSVMDFSYLNDNLFARGPVWTTDNDDDNKDDTMNDLWDIVGGSNDGDVLDVDVTELRQGGPNAGRGLMFEGSIGQMANGTISNQKDQKNSPQQPNSLDQQVDINIDTLTKMLRQDDNACQQQ